MDVLVLSGDLGPARSFDLDRELRTATTVVRPIVIVDLSGATHIHPAVMSVVIRHQRQARRQGGELQVVLPVDPQARRALDRVGLVGSVIPE